MLNAKKVSAFASDECMRFMSDGSIFCNRCFQSFFFFSGQFVLSASFANSLIKMKRKFRQKNAPTETLGSSDPVAYVNEYDTSNAVLLPPKKKVCDFAWFVLCLVLRSAFLAASLLPRDVLQLKTFDVVVLSELFSLIE